VFRTNRLPTIPIVEYPQGTFLKTENGYFYVKDATARYRFSTVRVLNSWSPQRIVNASENDAAVKRLKVLAKMKFRNGSLLYSQADGKMYLVSNGKVRHIKSPDILTGLNMRRQDAVWVSESEINLHGEGEPLS
jgi:hypothetical protein